MVDLTGLVTGAFVMAHAVTVCTARITHCEITMYSGLKILTAMHCNGEMCMHTRWRRLLLRATPQTRPMKPPFWNTPQANDLLFHWWCMESLLALPCPPLRSHSGTRGTSTTPRMLHPTDKQRPIFLSKKNNNKKDKRR